MPVPIAIGGAQKGERGAGLWPTPWAPLVGWWQLGCAKGHDGVVCLRYYRANGLYNTNKRTPLLYGNISKHSKRPGNGDGEAPARRQGQVEVEDAAAASPSAINVIVG